MSDTPRQLTGVFRAPDGTPLANRSITWFRARRRAGTQGASVIVDELVTTILDAQGQPVGTALVPGEYLARVRLADEDRFISISVTEGEGSFDVAEGADALAVEITPPLVAAAQAARDLARRWATEDPDVPVETGPDRFSARHHAEEAADLAGIAAASSTKAEAWADADKDVPVETGPDRFSAKHWAAVAEDFAESVSNPAPQTRVIATSGLATGGGDLSADRTITVAKASQAQAEAGTADDVAMTPLRTAQAIAEFAPPVDEVDGIALRNRVQAEVVAGGNSWATITGLAGVRALECVLAWRAHNDNEERTIIVALSSDNGSTWTGSLPLARSETDSNVYNGGFAFVDLDRGVIVLTGDGEPENNGVFNSRYQKFADATYNAVRFQVMGSAMQGNELIVIPIIKEGRVA